VYGHRIKVKLETRRAVPSRELITAQTVSFARRDLPYLMPAVKAAASSVAIPAITA
jgi:hypothetical protein